MKHPDDSAQAATEYDPGAARPTDPLRIKRLRLELRTYRRQVADLEAVLREHDGA